jgi:hypothetical protein
VAASTIALGSKLISQLKKLTIKLLFSMSSPL